MKITVIDSKLYNCGAYGISMMSGDRVFILGERTVELEGGKTVEQYVYNICGYGAKNGCPFVSLKENIVLENKEMINYV